MTKKDREVFDSIIFNMVYLAKIVLKRGNEQEKAFARQVLKAKKTHWGK